MYSLFWGALLGWIISKFGDYLVFYGKWKVQERDYNKNTKNVYKNLEKSVSTN